MSAAEGRQRRLRKRQRDSRKATKRWREVHSHSSADPVPNPGSGLRILSYDVIDEPLEDEDSSLGRLDLSPDEQAALFDDIRSKPDAVIPRLQALVQEHSGSPILLNWLTTAYQSAGDLAAAEAIANENFARNPHYLFARINVAEFALKRGELDRFREIFDNKFDLKLLYPHRNTFHISEYVALTSLLIHFFVRTKEIDAAQRLYDVLQQLAPDSDATKSCRLALQTALLLQLVSKATQRLHRRKR